MSPARPSVVLCAAAAFGAIAGSVLAQPASSTATSPRAPLVPPPTGADAQPIADDVFTGFSAPPIERPFADFTAAWPERFAPPGPIRAVVLEQQGTFYEPMSRRGSLFPVTRLDDEAGEAIRTFGALPEKCVFTAEHPGGQAWLVREIPEGNPSTPAQRLSADTILHVLSARPSPASDAPAGHPSLREHPVIDQTWFVVNPPTDPGTLRGVAVIMPGLFGLPPTIPERLAHMLNQDGWLTLRMLSQPSSFVEKMEFDLDPARIPESAAGIAAAFGQRSAECAYAVQAATHHLEESQPILATMPRVIAGISAGAMTLPTVVAREPDRYAAAMLIGGGCNFWHISETSNYTKGTETVRWEWKGGPPSDEIKDSLRLAYLAHAPLDSYHTARVLRGKPTLFIHANSDLAVPSPLGDALWKRAGEPERWSFVGSHEGVTLLGLPPLLPTMVTWIDKAVPRASNTGSTNSHGAKEGGTP